MALTTYSLYQSSSVSEYSIYAFYQASRVSEYNPLKDVRTVVNLGNCGNYSEKLWSFDGDLGGLSYDGPLQYDTGKAGTDGFKFTGATRLWKPYGVRASLGYFAVWLDIQDHTYVLDNNIVFLDYPGQIISPVVDIKIDSENRLDIRFKDIQYLTKPEAFSDRPVQIVYVDDWVTQKLFLNGILVLSSPHLSGYDAPYLNTLELGDKNTLIMDQLRLSDCPSGDIMARTLLWDAVSAAPFLQSSSVLPPVKEIFSQLQSIDLYHGDIFEQKSALLSGNGAKFVQKETVHDWVYFGIFNQLSKIEQDRYTVSLRRVN